MADTKTLDAGAPKIEVTPEMIEAGERALRAIGCNDDPDVLAQVAFKAMWGAMRTFQKKQT